LGSASGIYSRHVGVIFVFETSTQIFLQQVPVIFAKQVPVIFAKQVSVKDIFAKNSYKLSCKKKFVEPNIDDF
jgi:hypothetical protein